MCALYLVSGVPLSLSSSLILRYECRISLEMSNNSNLNKQTTQPTTKTNTIHTIPFSEFVIFVVVIHGFVITLFALESTHLFI